MPRVGWLRGRALVSTLLQHCLKREVHVMVQSVSEFVRAAGRHPFHPRHRATALAAVIAADSRTWASIWASSVRKQLLLSSLLHRILCFSAPCSVARVMVSFTTVNTQNGPTCVLIHNSLVVYLIKKKIKINSLHWPKKSTIAQWWKIIDNQITMKTYKQKKK